MRLVEPLYARDKMFGLWEPSPERRLNEIVRRHEALGIHIFSHSRRSLPNNESSAEVKPTFVGPRDIVDATECDTQAGEDHNAEG
jgi:hypothetical protein